MYFLQVHLELVPTHHCFPAYDFTPNRGPGESTLHPNKTAFLDLESLEVGAEGKEGFRSLLTLLELVT